MIKALESGQQLLDKLYDSPNNLPEIIFLDINMPGKSGFDCLKEIRKNAGPLGSVKIIMLSTSSSTENIDYSFELDADYYAVKPSTFKGPVDLLDRILQNGSGRRNNKKQKGFSAAPLKV